jgi:hypothetical protein
MGHGDGKGPGMAQGRANGLQGLVTAVARALGMGHGDANAPGMAHGVGKGLAIGHGGANAPGMAHGGSKGLAIGHGGANAPGMGHGGGKGVARGGGFGFGHASLGNPVLSSHSQNTSHRGETHDGRSLSSHSHLTQSVAPHQTDHSKKADQVVQVEDRGPGKEKGIVDSRPPGQELQPDRATALNPETIHSDLDNIVTLGLPPSREQQADRGMTLNPETIHSDLENIVTLGPPGQELQLDRATALNPETIHSDLDNIVTLGLPPSREQQADRGMTLNPETIHSDLENIVTLGPPGQEAQADRGRALNSDTFNSDLDSIVTLGPPGQELQLDRGRALNSDTFHSDLDDIVTLGPPLPASWSAKFGLWTIVPDKDETLATPLPHPWELGDDHAKMLPSTNSNLDDDDDAIAGWKLVPYFGAVLLFFSWIVQNGRGARKRKAATLKFEPNALRSIGSVNGPTRFTPADRFQPSAARPPTLDKFAAAFSIAAEGQQKAAADEKTPAAVQHFSGHPDVEEARAELEHAKEIEETLHKDFDGIGLG